MLKKIAAVVCIFTLLYSMPAFSYQREVRSDQGDQEEARPAPVPQEKEPGRGLMIGGYMLIGIGGAAAIAGSALAMSSSKRTAGIIVGSSGAALGLAGSFMLLFSSRSGGYGLAPQVDPAKNYYGLALAANF